MTTLISIFLFFNTATATNTYKTHILSIGESLQLPTSPSQNLRIQKKGIISLKDHGSSVLIVGKKIGATHIHLGSKIINILVVKKNIYTSWKQLKTWKEKKRGPEIGINSDSASITGKILTFNDFLDLNNFTDSTSQFYVKSDFENGVKEQISSFTKKLLKDNNLFYGKIIFSPYLKLLVPADQKNLLSSYKKLLNPYGVQISIDQYSLHQKPVIKMQLHIAHVKKSFFRNWGIKWPGEFSASVVPGSKIIGNSFNISLQNLESSGWGKVLATPTLVAQSGEQAQFHSGGEFPIRSSSQFTNKIHWKPYGLSLKAKPIANTQGALQIHIETEFSAIDKSVSSDGVPGITRSTMSTTINMQRPRPMILSGLIQTDSNESREGLAWLSQIPLLKPLFSQGDIYNSEYELVFILNPSFI